MGLIGMIGIVLALIFLVLIMSILLFLMIAFLFGAQEIEQEGKVIRSVENKKGDHKL